MSDVAPKIVVVGSSNVDFIVRSDRLPRPGETVTGSDLITAGGGKGANQAIACRRLGATVNFVTRIGDDGPGQFTLAAFRAEGLHLAHVNVDRGTPTGVALILVDRDGQNMIALSPGANSKLTIDDVRAAASAFVGSQVLITQLEVPLTTVRFALEEARARGITTMLNPAPATALPNDLLALADWLTPNEVEAAILANRSVDDVPSAIAVARVLRSRGPRNVVITLGSRGAVIVTPEVELAVPACPVAAVDATAAGDAFTGGLAFSLAQGYAAREAVQFASACGALAATRPGAQPSLPGLDEVKALLASTSGTGG